MAREAAVLDARARLAETLVKEAERAEQLLSQPRAAREAAGAAIAAEGFSEEKFRAAKDRFDRARRRRCARRSWRRWKRGAS